MTDFKMSETAVTGEIEALVARIQRETERGGAYHAAGQITRDFKLCADALARLTAELARVKADRDEARQKQGQWAARALTAEAALAKAGEVEREVLFFTSYCGGDTKGCTEARPCASCLGMSNVFRVRGPMTYVRQLAPEWLTDVPVMPDAQARKIEKRAVRRMKRAAAAIRARATGESP